MSYITVAEGGLAAVEKRNWDEAIDKLSFALELSPNPAWLIGRSKALVGLNRLEEALDDACLAWYKAYDRNKRELMTEAQYRRSVVYFRMKQYANSDCCAFYAIRLLKGSPAVEGEDPAKAFIDEKGNWTFSHAMVKNETFEDDQKNKKSPGGEGGIPPQQPQAWRMASTMRYQATALLEKLPEDDAARKVTTTYKPVLKDLATIKSTKARPVSSDPVPVQATASKPQVPSDTPLRLQEFQSNTNMSVSIFSKGNDKEGLKVEFHPYAVVLDSVVYPSGDKRAFQLDLWGEIDTVASKYTVTPNKIELSLLKKVAGKWPELKGESKPLIQSTAVAAGGEAKSSSSTKAKENAPATASETPVPQPPAKGPAYPTSSRSGPKDWDSIGKDEGSDDEKDVNKFFKEIYKTGTDEQKRAMMKSFTESNGTSLSTDWNDVKDRTVEVVPPEGVEAKKWD